MKIITKTLDPKTCKTWDGVYFAVIEHMQNLDRLQRAGILKVMTHLHLKNYLIPHSIEMLVSDIGNSNCIVRLIYNILDKDDNAVAYTINASSPSGATVFGLVIDIPKYGIRYSDLDKIFKLLK